VRDRQGCSAPVADVDDLLRHGHRAYRWAVAAAKPLRFGHYVEALRLVGR
jgi:hypothetical protein